ncbi:MAG: class I SAM-dependent methyltransferase [Acidobacteriota bacterium]
MNSVDPWAPLGAALLAYHDGRHDAVLRVDSDVFDSEDVAVRLYYRPDEDALPDLDQRALDRCAGRILDIGAGAGRHALDLQCRGLEVTALDVSADAVRVMQDRGISDVRQGDIYTSDPGSYDTILLLMNGIGLAGSHEGLQQLFGSFRRLLRPGGRVIFDAAGLDAAVHKDEFEELSDMAIGRPQLGEVFFRLTFDDLEGSWYPWLFPTSTMMAEAARDAGFECTIIGRGARGAFLVELTR